MLDISVVVPLFNEGDNIHELYARLSRALDELRVGYELVFVDDGSSDATPLLLEDLRRRDSGVVIVTLSRNFGHQAAISAGIDLARGAAVIIMDGDLQDPPEVLGQFIDAWRDGNDVVYAIRARRREGLLKRAGYALFYRLLRAVSDIDIPLDSGDFGLMDRKVVNVLKQLPEKQRFVRGLRAFVGFQQLGVSYERGARSAGTPKYKLRQLLRLALDGLFDFSSLPLRLVTGMGLVIGLTALVLTTTVLTRCILQQNLPDRWMMMLVVVLLLSSVQLLSLGIIGAYVQRIFREIKGRPGYIVKHVRDGQAEGEAPITAALPAACRYRAS